MILAGGTHNPFAPPFPFLAEACLPLLNRMGAHVTAQIVRPGFYATTHLDIIRAFLDIPIDVSGTSRDDVTVKFGQG